MPAVRSAHRWPGTRPQLGRLVQLVGGFGIDGGQIHHQRPRFGVGEDAASAHDNLVHLAPGRQDGHDRAALRRQHPGSRCSAASAQRCQDLQPAPGRMSWTTSLKPFRTQFDAMPLPIAPRPMNPIVSSWIATVALPQMLFVVVSRNVPDVGLTDPGLVQVAGMAELADGKICAWPRRVV